MLGTYLTVPGFGLSFYRIEVGCTGVGSVVVGAVFCVRIFEGRFNVAGHGKITRALIVIPFKRDAAE